MPHLRMRAMESAHVAKLSEVLSKELAVAVNTAEDNFTFELVETKFFANGKETKSFPFIEVLWFARTQQVQDACAAIITSRCKEFVGEQDVVVIFQELTKTAYYENNVHF